MSGHSNAAAGADSIMVALALMHGGILLVFPTAAIIALGVWWNSNTISHNFIHRPCFASNALNRAYSLYLTLLLGIPQTLWRARHLAHHAASSVRQPRTTARSAWTAVEAAAVLLLWTVLFLNAPEFFLYAYLPGYFVGLALCYLHGYFEHAPRTASHYGSIYNLLFFNDGYHVEHHRRPSEHWTRLPTLAGDRRYASPWPAIFRWVEIINLETLERLVLRCPPLQKYLLTSHEAALRKLLPEISFVRTITIVGGGMFPRTAIVLRKLLPGTAITILDANSRHLDMAKPFLKDSVQYEHRHYCVAEPVNADLLVIPLAFHGDRKQLYLVPPAPAVLVHDWIWAKKAVSVVVSAFLLKRMNLVLR